MRTILPMGALLALNLAGCSNSADLLTGPDNIDIKPSIDPHGLYSTPEQ
jgi:hypothetical protein